MQTMYPLETLAGGDVSNELAAILASIADITAAAEPKYSPAVSRRLVRWIVCRSYAGPLRELCHLVVAAERVIGPSAGTQGYETMFWDTGVASAAAFRAFFRDNEGSAGVERLGGGIRVAYADGAFGIAYTRMPFLSALMEFLVSSSGYADLDAKLRAIPASHVTKGAVDALANDLSRQIYHYLSAHLPGAQAQRKFRAVIAFLRRTGGGADDGAVGPHDIDDDTVLEFWISASADDRIGGGAAGDFKSFRSVFRLMAAARDALAAAAQAAAIGHARPIGGDRSAGEIDPGAIAPEAVDAALAPLHERQAPLDLLRTPPASGIKYLKQTESDAIAPIIDYGGSALALPLSVLRFQVMGAVQGRLTEALRRGEDPLSMIPADPLDGRSDRYGDFADYIDTIGDHLETALLASLHHLLAAQREEAITLLLYLRPHVDLSPLAPMFATPDDEDEAVPGGGQVIHLKAPDTEDRFVRALTAGLDHCPELAALIGEAGNAAKRLTRKGFKDADWGEGHHGVSGRADACATAADSLILIRDMLVKFSARLRRLTRQPGGWADQYLSDHEIFCARFRALYGDVR